jgi:phosphonoacetate hydrolase
MQSTTVLMVIDGLDPEYLAASPATNLGQLAKEGFRVDASAVMPTVTNVNNVSLVTGSYPEVHGINSNFWLNRNSGEEVYTESGEFIGCETMFQRAAQQGGRTLLVTAKDKLRTLLGDGATLSVSSECPPGWVVEGVGEPPPIYSVEVNQWVVDAARFILSNEPYDLAYVTTTDYAMHTFAPEEPESQRHMELLDQAVGKLVETLPSSQVLITADHGMSEKSTMVHLPGVLAAHGIEASAVPIIKDRYTVHHSNLGGCIYLYLAEGQIETALAVLADTDGVDEALDREQAAGRFHLMPDRIGDIMVMAGPPVVFGDPQQVDLPPRLRSHGSLHEAAVPIIGWGGSFHGHQFRENVDLGRYVFQHVLA